jgi:hypothetical protein
MATTSKPVNNIKNGLVGSTVTVSPGYGAIPLTHNLPGHVGVTPLTVGQVHTTNNTGSFLTSGSNGTSWSNPNDNVMVVSNNPASLEVKGRVKINGRDLEDRLDTIEKVLQIPERDAILEKKHPKLQKMYHDYINELAKYRMWQAIKGDTSE